MARVEAENKCKAEEQRLAELEREAQLRSLQPGLLSRAKNKVCDGLAYCYEKLPSLRGGGSSLF